MVRLSDEQAERYRNCPVIWDVDSGDYIFPVNIHIHLLFLIPSVSDPKHHQPNEDNLVKFSTHTGGYLNLVDIPGASAPISKPRTISSHPENGSMIPKEAIVSLRERLARVYPELAELPFHSTRMCWFVPFRS